MNLSVYLLAIGLTANQSAAQSIPSDQPGVQYAAPAPVYSSSQAQPDEGHRPLFPRLHTWLFGSKNDQQYTPTANSCGKKSAPLQQVESAPPPRAIMTGETVRPVQQVRLEIKKENLSRIGAAPDYTWVTGQLFRIHAGGEIHWVVRYAPPEQEDKHGGSIVLASGADMKSFREGDLICVHGVVLDDQHAARHLGGVLYRADSIDLIERGEANALDQPR